MATTNFLWDRIEHNLIGEFDEGFGKLAAYVAKPATFGAVMSQRRTDSGVRYFQSDALGSITELTDSTSVVTDTYRPTAFGETTESMGTTTCPARFKGRHGYYTDRGTSDISLRRRKYIASSARWLSCDPLGFGNVAGNRPDVEQLSRYVYCEANPVNNIDPSGLEPTTISTGEQSVPNYDQGTIWQTSCNETEKQCIELARQRILELFTRTNDGCFTDPDIKPTTMQAICRAQLSDCVRSVLSYVRLDCGTKANYAGCKDYAFATGSCVGEKDWGRAAKAWKCKTDCHKGRNFDQTCNACSPGSLLASSIIFCVGNDKTFPGPDRITPEDDWCKGDALNRVAERLLHEALHHCVGAHTGESKLPSAPGSSRSRKPTDICHRPDVSVLMSDVVNNCPGIRILDR